MSGFLLGAIMKISWLFCLTLGFSSLLSAQEVKLLNTYVSDEQAFIQGLELNSEGKLLYSSGLYGKSEVGYLTLNVNMREVKDRLAPEFFGEGLTITPYGIWQLSWQEQTAFLRNSKTLKVEKMAHYLGEGWGLAYDKMRGQLWLSNGSDKLQIFQPQTFEKQGEISVRYLGQPVFRLNELEFANGFIYANIWQTNFIVKIEPAQGEVVKIYDLTPWVSELGLSDPNDVLNGIAHISEDRFYVTGKRFPVIWEMELK